MDHVINVSAVRDKMTDRPIGQRLHNFFNGATKILTRAQIDEVEKVIKASHEEVMGQIRDAKKVVKN